MTNALSGTAADKLGALWSWAESSGAVWDDQARGVCSNLDTGEFEGLLHEVASIGKSFHEFVRVSLASPVHSIDILAQTPSKTLLLKNCKIDLENDKPALVLAKGVTEVHFQRGGSLQASLSLVLI
jgi:hypothetical protein